jgi:hypothetical protein
VSPVREKSGRLLRLKTLKLKQHDFFSAQGVAGNKKGEFEVEVQFLNKLDTNNGYFLPKLLLKGTKNEAQFLRLRFLLARDPL